MLTRQVDTFTAYDLLRLHCTRKIWYGRFPLDIPIFGLYVGVKPIIPPRKLLSYAPFVIKYMN